MSSFPVVTINSVWSQHGGTAASDEEEDAEHLYDHTCTHAYFHISAYLKTNSLLPWSKPNNVDNGV